VALTTCHSKVGVVSPEKMGAKNFYISSVSRGLPDLMANICWTKRQGRWKVRRVSYVVQKFHELWSTYGLKPDRSFYLPSLSFCANPSHTLYAALTWRPTATLDETTLGSSAARFQAPKHVKLEMLSRRAALSGSR